jgi:FOG: PKD repeat
MKIHEKITGKLMAGLLVLCLLFSLIPVAFAADGYIAVGDLPSPDFAGTPLRGKAPLEVQFTDSSYKGAEPNPTYLWNFGDGTTSSQAGSVKHTYTKEGNYTVSLTITNVHGNRTETKTNYIYVGGGVVADFTADKTTGPSPLAVKFTDKSLGNPTKYAWDFGDGGTSSEKNPSHTYTGTGTYTVKLTVSNEFGNDTKTSTSFINVGTAPYVFFTANGTINSKQVTFTTHGNVADSATYRWDFGDGSTSAEKDPIHTYKSTGVYNVTLAVSNAYGTYNYTLKNVSITDTLKADFSATNNMGSAPLNVKFTDTSIGSGNTSSFLWNFGDGTTSTERNPSHTYNRTGQYTVALTVTNPCGATNSTLKSSYVSVGNVPVADFIGTPTSGLSPLNVQFTDQSRGDNLTYSWDFGDGTTSTEKSPKHTYTAEGTYTVKLTVKNAYGTNTATKDKYITVGTAPRADFQADVLSGIAPHPVQFTDLSKGNPTSWHWDFGDGATSTEKNPRHTYAKSGYYNVTLTIKNAYGESQLLREGNGVKVWAEDKAVAAPPVEDTTNKTPDTPATTNESDEKDSSIPGFGLIFALAAIAGLVGVGAYQRKKNNK